MSVAFRYVVGAICLYESVACFTRRMPTISEWVCRDGRRGDVVEGLIVGGLALHFAMGDAGVRRSV